VQIELIKAPRHDTVGNNGEPPEDGQDAGHTRERHPPVSLI
jgi:hypothetical protein